MNPPDTIEIRRLHVSTHIGVPEEERSQAQTIFLTVRMHPTRGFNPREDNILHTIDYDAVAKELRVLAAARPRQLIETLACDCAAHLLSQHPLDSVSITIEKHVLPGTKCVAVSIHRTR